MNLRSIVRASAPIALAATTALVLSACGSSSDDSSKPSAGSTASASPTASASTTPVSTADACSLKPGAASDAITVTGELGQVPTVKVNGAPNATTIERAVPIKGAGEEVASGDTVNAYLSMFNGAGKKIADGAAKVPIDNTVTPVFLDALTCVTYGSRSVVAAPASSMYTDAQLPTGIKSTDTIIIVADIVSKYTVPAPPKPAAWTEQVPTVTFDAAGTPTLKLTGAPLATFALKVLREGTGSVVKSGDSVTVNYQGTNWNTGKIFDQSYGKAPATFKTDEVVQGFGGALVGQKVGTRLVVTMPPDLGYGAAASKDNPLAGQTLVFVIEIIKTASS